jgi:hypothetical protein
MKLKPGDTVPVVASRGTANCESGFRIQKRRYGCRSLSYRSWKVTPVLGQREVGPRHTMF